MNESIAKQYAIIKKGYGYWDITHYPYGGCFKRTDIETIVEIIEQSGAKKTERKVRFDDGRLGIVDLSGMIDWSPNLPLSKRNHPPCDYCDLECKEAPCTCGDYDE